MLRSGNLFTLAPGLPEPVDEGCCDRLPRLAWPPLPLPSTAGATVELAALLRAEVGSVGAASPARLEG